jgi:hypothetical protein
MKEPICCGEFIHSMFLANCKKWFGTKKRCGRIPAPKGVDKKGVLKVRI